MSTRNRVFGWIGVVWGGAVVLNVAMNGVSRGSGAYTAGSVVAVVFGIALLVVGALTLNRQPRY